MPDNKKDLHMRDIDFQVDTVRVETSTGGYFMPSKNSVTLNYKPNNDRWNEWAESDYVLIHEQKHRDNAAAGLYHYAVDPEQAYKLNMHDEISANMASLLLLRQKYLENGDVSVFEKEENGRFDFYGDAIRSGKIKPGSRYSEDFDKEMSLIVNGTRDMWEKMFSAQYNDSSMWDAKYSSDRSGKYAAYYDQNYQRGMKIAYTIGGVDFTKYMDRDAEIPSIGKWDLKMLSADGKGNQKLAAEFGVPAFDGSMSLQQYQKLVQHQLTMNRFLENAPSYCGKKAYLNMICLNQVAFDTEKDTALRDSIKSSLDRSKGDFAVSYRQIDKQLINALVNSVAKDYAAQGKKLPAANEKAYNQAVDKIYTYPFKSSGDVNYNGDVNLRHSLCDEKMFDAKLPEYAQSVEKMDWWQRGLNKWSDFVGLSDEKKDNVNAQIQNAGPLKKYGLGTLLYIGAPVASAVEKGMSWFEDKKEEKVENKPLKAINTKAPEYRKWKNEDGSRVSEVQYRTLPDFTKDVIQKPTKSLAEEQVVSGKSAENADREKMIRAIEHMNKINGAGNEVEASAVVDALCDKYGDQAYQLMLSAVNEPYKYAQFVGDGSIKTSRAALNHLCSAEGQDKQEAEKLLSMPKRDGQEQSSDGVGKMSIGMQRGHDRIAALRAKVAAGHEAGQPCIRKFSAAMIMPRPFANCGVQKRSAAEPCARRQSVPICWKDSYKNFGRSLKPDV